MSQCYLYLYLCVCPSDTQAEVYRTRVGEEKRGIQGEDERNADRSRESAGGDGVPAAGLEEA